MSNNNYNKYGSRNGLRKDERRDGLGHGYGSTDAGYGGGNRDGNGNGSRRWDESREGGDGYDRRRGGIENGNGSGRSEKKHRGGGGSDGYHRRPEGQSSSNGGHSGARQKYDCKRERKVESYANGIPPSTSKRKRTDRHSKRSHERRDRTPRQHRERGAEWRQSAMFEAEPIEMELNQEIVRKVAPHNPSNLCDGWDFEDEVEVEDNKKIVPKDNYLLEAGQAGGHLMDRRPPTSPRRQEQGQRWERTHNKGDDEEEYEEDEAERKHTIGSAEAPAPQYSPYYKGNNDGDDKKAEEKRAKRRLEVYRSTADVQKSAAVPEEPRSSSPPMMRGFYRRQDSPRPSSPQYDDPEDEMEIEEAPRQFYHQYEDQEEEMEDESGEQKVMREEIFDQNDEDKNDVVVESPARSPASFAAPSPAYSPAPHSSSSSEVSEGEDDDDDDDDDDDGFMSLEQLREREDQASILENFNENIAATIRRKKRRVYVPEERRDIPEENDGVRNGFEPDVPEDPREEVEGGDVPVEPQGIPVQNIVVQDGNDGDEVMDEGQVEEEEPNLDSEDDEPEDKDPSEPRDVDHDGIEDEDTEESDDDDSEDEQEPKPVVTSRSGRVIKPTSRGDPGTIRAETDPDGARRQRKRQMRMDKRKLREADNRKADNFVKRKIERTLKEIKRGK